MLKISAKVSIPDEEIALTAIHAQGSGGQNVNKVASAIHLRFDISASSLPDFYKQRLRNLRDQRISKAGIIVLKAQRYRTQDQNREDALNRLQTLIQSASFTEKARRPTKPSKNAKKKRMDRKTQRGKTKVLRGKVSDF